MTKNPRQSLRSHSIKAGILSQMINPTSQVSCICCSQCLCCESETLWQYFNSKSNVAIGSAGPQSINLAFFVQIEILFWFFVEYTYSSCYCYILCRFWSPLIAAPSLVNSIQQPTQSTELLLSSVHISAGGVIQFRCVFRVYVQMFSMIML